MSGVDAVRFARYRFQLTAREPIVFPRFSGFALHGALGESLRTVACSRRDECGRGPCRNPERCVYGYVFEAAGRGDRRLNGSHDLHPYVLQPPLLAPWRYERGETFEVGVVLIGAALDCVDTIIDAFTVLAFTGVGAGRGRGHLTAVAEDRPTFPDERAGGPPHPGSLPECATAEVDFVTPTRLKEAGQFVRGAVSFRLLATRLLDRVSDLMRVHCGADLNLNRRWLLAQAAAVSDLGELPWRDQPHYSRRQDSTMMLGGVVGRVRYTGRLSPLVPFLRLGEYVHVGKATSFGLGQMRVTIAPRTDDSVPFPGDGAPAGGLARG